MYVSCIKTVSSVGIIHVKIIMMTKHNPYLRKKTVKWYIRTYIIIVSVRLVEPSFSFIEKEKCTPLETIKYCPVQAPEPEHNDRTRMSCSTCGANNSLL